MANKKYKRVIEQDLVSPCRYCTHRYEDKTVDQGFRLKDTCLNCKSRDSIASYFRYNKIYETRKENYDT